MKKSLAIICILLFLAILPHLVGTYYVNLLTSALIFAVFAMSLDLVFGYLDLPSLGHAAFYGAAAYSVGILSNQVSTSFLLNFLLAICVACVVGALFGLLALRTQEASFFIITLAMSQMLWAIAFKWRSFTGGEDGIPGIQRPDLSFLSWDLGSATQFYYFVFVFFLLALILLHVIVHSPFGHIIKGIRENELRMRALGYNTFLYKYIWFIISGIFGGLSGILAVYFNGYVSPADLGIATSAEGLIMVLLGGPATLIGPIIGAGSIVFLRNLISGWTERWLLILGAIYVLVVIFTPGGLLHLIKNILSRGRVTS